MIDETQKYCRYQVPLFNASFHTHVIESHGQLILFYIKLIQLQPRYTLFVPQECHSSFPIKEKNVILDTKSRQPRISHFRTEIVIKYHFIVVSCNHVHFAFSLPFQQRNNLYIFLFSNNLSISYVHFKKATSLSIFSQQETRIKYCRNILHSSFIQDNV